MYQSMTPAAAKSLTKSHIPEKVRIEKPFWVTRGARRTKRQHLLVRQAPRGTASWCDRRAREAKHARGSYVPACVQLARAWLPSVSLSTTRASGMRISRATQRLSHARCSRRAHLECDSRRVAREMRAFTSPSLSFLFLFSFSSLPFPTCISPTTAIKHQQQQQHPKQQQQPIQQQQQQQQHQQQQQQQQERQ